MSKFNWEPEYSIGHAEIDRQHQAIITIMNRLYGLLKDKTAERYAEVEQLFDDLANYVSTHFAYEEELMRRAGYPAEKIADHKLAHNELLAVVQQLMAAHQEGDAQALANLLPFLYGNWLIDHICETDRDYAGYVLAMES